MVILALDTTTRGGSVAVLEDDRVLALVPGDPARSHGERLPGEIEEALGRASLRRSAIDLLAVATGPGAFTGLRIGLATMQGLAMTLDRPVIGVSALDALAVAASDGTEPLVAPWMDAQRGDVFAALVDVLRDETVMAPIADNPAAVLDTWRPRIAGTPVVFIGDAVARDEELISRAGGGKWITRIPPPLAPAIARIGRARAGRGEAGSPHRLAPIYVRRPDVEIERERRKRQ